MKYIEWKSSNSKSHSSVNSLAAENMGLLALWNLTVSGISQNNRVACIDPLNKKK